jgi:hypothetical protein
MPVAINGDGTITGLNSGGLPDGSVTNDDLAGAIASAKITDLDAAKLTGTIHVDRLTNAPATDLSQLEMNQALLAFKIAASNQLAKFSMVDQVIDEYQDATGIDAGASTNESAQGATTAKYYEGGSSASITATGGSITTDGTDTIHTFTSSGNFVTNTAITIDYLVIAGGGGGGASIAGGGGAGGLRNSYNSETSGGGGSSETAISATASTYTVTVGDGGAGGVTSAVGTSGSASSLVGTNANITTVGGGGGGHHVTGASGTAGTSGGSGGGSPAAVLNGPAGTTNQGYAGGDGAANFASNHGNYSPAGGGGAGAVGGQPANINATDPSGFGGNGIQSSISGTSYYYAAGGGGGGYSTNHIAGNGGLGGGGGGGAGAGATAGTGGTGGTADGGSGGAAGASSVAGAGGVNTGSGGGGGGPHGTGTGGAGGKGIVIIRRPTSLVVTGTNLTLQSVATTADSAPTTGDLVVLIDDGGSGTSAVQTNIKGFISRNGNFATLDTDHKQVTFVDQGTWGTTKQKILVARNVDLSGITTGTSMKYKLTTHSQSAGTMETRIHATSLAWA